MTEIWVKKIQGVLLPALPNDALLFESIKAGVPYAFDFKKKRNGKFHNKYFAMLDVVLHHTEHWENVEQIRKRLLIQIGHFDMIWDAVSQELVPEAKSMSFASMDEVEFNRIYQDSLTVILKHYMPPNWDTALFESAMNSIMDFA